MSIEDECVKFLKELQRYIEEGRVDFIPAVKNKEALSNLGISIEDALYTVAELTVRNYHKGPEKDYKYEDQLVWKFGVEDFFYGESYPFSVLYLKVAIRPSMKDMVVLSFHPAEYPMDLPFKDKKLLE